MPRILAQVSLKFALYCFVKRTMLCWLRRTLIPLLWFFIHLRLLELSATITTPTGLLMSVVEASFKSRNDGILGVAPNSIYPLKGSVKYQICNAYNHSALDCTNRFNHSFTSSKLHNSLAAINFDDDVASTWYPDSGASAHMTGNQLLPNSSTPYFGHTLVMVDNCSKLPITYTGSITLNNLKLNNVLLVPDIKKNLISIHKLCLDNNCTAEFTPSSFLAKDQTTLQSQLSCSTQ
ncbi:hypothetical protein LIER_30648 [Lithospermum erythrorhizon]|uniref:Retrovirus-related Pol polyprotein from transposon TNT 1-94-like beta-barrel domain-containing protein n=1 Tax=Lithospermum erythrorhizon TaxID=34254 RepID=A0AAV3RPE0_LITER